MRVTSDLVGGCVVLTVVGEIDAVTAPSLLAQIRSSLVDIGRGPLVVDLTAVTFMGSAGLAVLVSAAKDAGQRGVPLRIAADQARPVLRPLEVTGLDDVLPIYGTLRDALTDSGG